MSLKNKISLSFSPRYSIIKLNYLKIKLSIKKVELPRGKDSKLVGMNLLIQLLKLHIKKSYKNLTLESALILSLIM